MQGVFTMKKFLRFLKLAWDWEWTPMNLIIDEDSRTGEKTEYGKLIADQYGFVALIWFILHFILASVVWTIIALLYVVIESFKDLFCRKWKDRKR